MKLCISSSGPHSLSCRPSICEGLLEAYVPEHQKQMVGVGSSNCVQGAAPQAAAGERPRLQRHSNGDVVKPIQVHKAVTHDVSRHKQQNGSFTWCINTYTAKSESGIMKPCMRDALEVLSRVDRSSTLKMLTALTAGEDMYG